MALDPDVANLIAAVASAAPPPMETLSPAEARAGFAQMRDALFPVTPPAAIETITPEGGPALRLYRPANRDREPLPALVFIHGGGWVLGDLDLYDSLCATLAVEAGVCVASVGYRLAPEAPFPAAFDDSLATLRWLVGRATTLGIDPDRVAIGGESAGGALAASVAVAARDAGGPPLRGLMMLYPVTDLAEESFSYAENGDGYVLTAAAMRWFRGHYLAREQDARDWRASPLLAPGFAGLPPTFLLTCGFDPLRDEGIAFVRALEAAGVPVTHRHLPDQVHGFLMWGKVVPAATSALSEVAMALRSLLGLPG